VAALSLIVDVRTDGRTDGSTDGRTDGRTFLPGLLGHLGGDDLKIQRGPDFMEHDVVLAQLDITFTESYSEIQNNLL